MKKFGLVGKDISYSKSKEIFDSRYQGKYSYEIIDTDKISKELLLEYDGLNITTPYKVEVMKFLDGLSFNANEIGNVNCIKNVCGQLIGENTDYIGFSKSLLPYYNGIKRILVLGNGGVVNTIRHYCKKNENELVVCGRNGEFDINYSELNDYDFDCIVNATKFGVIPPIDYKRIKDSTLVFDLCYGNSTLFLNECEKNGHKKNINGDNMLKWQALQSYRIWNLEKTI